MRLESGWGTGVRSSKKPAFKEENSAEGKMVAGVWALTHERANGKKGEKIAGRVKGHVSVERATELRVRAEERVSEFRGGKKEERNERGGQDPSNGDSGWRLDKDFNAGAQRPKIVNEQAQEGESGN